MCSDQSQHQSMPGRFSASRAADVNRYRLTGSRISAGNAVGGGGTTARVSESSMAPLSMDSLENGIECVIRALSLAPQDDSELPGELDSLAVSHPNLFSLARVGDYESLMNSASRALAFFPEAHPNQPKWLSSLGASHGDRFKRLHELNDLEKAIEYITRALNLACEDDPNQPTRFNDLGEYYGYRFRCLGELGDLEKAVGYARRAVAMTPEGHPDQAKRLNNLGTLHNHRFERLGVLGDNEKAIECGTFALALTPDGHSDLPKWLSTFGASHSSRFRRLGESGDSKLAIDSISRSVILTPDGHPDLSHRLNSLSESHRDRFQYLGGLNDLETAMKCTRRALDLAPDGHPELPIWLNSLGALYGDRFRRLGELTDSGESIKYISQALDLISSNHPDLPKLLSNLGISYRDQFRRLNELNDLAVAIDSMSRALALTPDDHLDHAARLNGLGELYGYRFRRLGDLGDLNKAMDHVQRALVSTSDDHPELPLRLNNQGVLYSDRFRRLGKVEDSDHAIKYGTRALLSTPPSHPDLPKMLSCLGVSYGDRFKSLDELDDLKLAIEHMYRAVDLTPENHPELSHRLSNLSATHRRRFQRRGELDDYERAIEHASRALDLTPDDHPDKPNRLHDLGELYGDQFRQSNQLEKLDRAIEYMSQAVNLTPDGHPDLPNWLNSLGECHGDRFQHLEEVPDLERAVNHAHRALALTPEGHPSLPAKYSLMARLRIFQYSITPSDLYLEDTLKLFRMAAKSSAGAPGTKFKIALDWASLTSDYGSLECIEAYQTTIDLLPQYVWLGATTNQRYENLLAAVNLAVNASAAATRSGDYALALEWMEQARCVVWNQILRLRSPVDELHDVHPALATRLLEVAKQLNIASSESRESRARSSGSMTPEEVGQEHRRMAREYDNLLSEARKLPGFEDFLQPKTANVLVNAAQRGPIVVINCHKEGCDALIITPGNESIDHTPLPNFNEGKAERARSEIRRSIRGMGLRGAKMRSKPSLKNDEFETLLAVLWYDVVKPVLERLGYTNTPTDHLPHITWCLTGAATFLPLHAAGDYSRPASRVFDYVISSYTPTLTVLLTSASSSLSLASRVLALGVEFTPGHSPLPGVAREINVMRGHIQGKALYSELLNRQATVAAAVEAMENNDWIHLACHAYQDLDNPNESGFFMFDDILNMASINQQPFKNKGLAYLAACQTATGDEKLPDEAIHLASGLLMTGYASVIATMWSIYDTDAVLVADKVYGELMKDSPGKVGNGEVGKALHCAIANLRENVGEKEFGRWVPYIHMGS